MVRASGARLLAPVRKSAHSLWLYVAYGRALNASDPTGPGERHEESGASSEDPVLILPRGQPLPYAPPRPLRIAVNKKQLQIEFHPVGKSVPKPPVDTVIVDLASHTVVSH